MWGSVKKGHTGGLCHIVWRWHLRRPTGPHSGQPVSPPVLALREKDLHVFSQSHQSLDSTVLSLTLLDSPLTGLACLKAPFVRLLQPEVDSLFCFCGEIFPQNTTVPIPQPWVSRTKEASVSLTPELKNEKLSSHWIFPVQSFSSHIQRNVSPPFAVMICIKYSAKYVFLSKLYAGLTCKVFSEPFFFYTSKLSVGLSNPLPGLLRLIQLKRHCLSCITFILNNYKWILSSSACSLLPMWGPLRHSSSTVMNV